MKILFALILVMTITYMVKASGPEHSNENENGGMGSSEEAMPCNSTSCLNNGTCLWKRRCNCVNGFYGAYCEKIDYCSSSPCTNPYRCKNELASYSCVCPPGYTDVNCTTQIDYCAENPCQNNGTCTNVINRHPTYKCKCVNGYFGSNCERIDYCYSATPVCQNRGRCFLTDTSYICRCNKKYTGQNCETLKQ